MRNAFRREFAVLAGIALTYPMSDARGQEPTPSAPTQCSAAAYRQFDFWVGDWDVRGRDGSLLGTNRIEKIQGGCVLQEHWRGARGDTGTSFNIYDFTRDVWHQTWVSGASLLILEGGFEGGRMVLEGTTVQADGQQLRNRITWTPVGPDEVTQVWETSSDGEAWNVVFDGVYRRK